MSIMLPPEPQGNNQGRGWFATELHPEDVERLVPVFERLRVPREPDRCWLWAGATNRLGYGVVATADARGRRGHLAHRVAWVLASGTSLLPDVSIDHLCRNTRCSNPGHLEPVSIEENLRRAYEHKGLKPQLAPQPKPAKPKRPTFETDDRGREICPHCNVAFSPRYVSDHILRIHPEAA